MRPKSLPVADITERILLNFGRLNVLLLSQRAALMKHIEFLGHVAAGYGISLRFGRRDRTKAFDEVHLPGRDFGLRYLVNVRSFVVKFG